MTQEEKQLLIKDLCARLPYWINILTEDNDKGYIVGVDDTENGMFEIHILEDGDSYTCDESIENFKPYLRPMSSMTKEEREDWYRQSKVDYDCEFKPEPTLSLENCHLSVDWLIVHHFDYRGLIEKGLALEAPEDMYIQK